MCAFFGLMQLTSREISIWELSLENRGKELALFHQLDCTMRPFFEKDQYIIREWNQGSHQSVVDLIGNGEDITIHGLISWAMLLTSLSMVKDTTRKKKKSIHSFQSFSTSVDKFRLDSIHQQGLMITVCSRSIIGYTTYISISLLKNY